MTSAFGRIAPRQKSVLANIELSVLILRLWSWGAPEQLIDRRKCSHNRPGKTDADLRALTLKTSSSNFQ